MWKRPVPSRPNSLCGGRFERVAVWMASGQDHDVWFGLVLLCAKWTKVQRVLPHVPALFPIVVILIGRLSHHVHPWNDTRPYCSFNEVLFSSMLWWDLEQNSTPSWVHLLSPPLRTWDFVHVSHSRSSLSHHVWCMPVAHFWHLLVLSDHILSFLHDTRHNNR